VYIRTPARRILSLIPEASVEDSDSVRAASTTSSEKEVYRRSILALDLLNTSEITDASSTGSGTLTINANRPDRASRSSSEGSEIMTVSQMYHGEGRGGRSGQGHLHS
jgi:hypothetical protein